MIDNYVNHLGKHYLWFDASTFAILFQVICAQRVIGSRKETQCEFSPCPPFGTVQLQPDQLLSGTIMTLIVRMDDDLRIVEQDSDRTAGFSHPTDANNSDPT